MFYKLNEVIFPANIDIVSCFEGEINLKII